MELKQLEAKVREYAKAYYEGDALISDDEFDALVDKIRELDSNSPVFTVGWGYNIEDTNMTKHQHLYGQPGSLDKKKTKEEVISVFGVKSLIATPKLDGISVIQYYKDGYFYLALTRGRNNIGTDITNKMKYFVPRYIDGFTGAIRGEFILKTSNYKKYYANNPSARNVAAGMANRKEFDIEELKTRFNFVVYKVFADLNQIFPSNKNDMLNKLKDLGFETVNWSQVESDQCTPENILELMNQFSQNGEILLDGIVLTENEFINHKQEGIEYSEVAYKIQTETATTTVLDIYWNDTRTGKYVPSIKIDPVVISGAEVKSPTGHNAKWIFDRKIGIGSTITIVRSGEVIPHILGTIIPSEKYNVPVHCYHCGQNLQMVGTDLCCVNDACSGKEEYRLWNWIHICGDIDGLGDSFIEKVLDFYNIKTVNDLLTKNIDLNLLQEITGIGESVSKRIVNMINQIRGEITPEQFLVSLSIDLLSVKNAKKIIENRLFQDVIDHKYDQLNNLSSFPKRIIEGFQKMEVYIDNLLPLVKIKQEVKNESKKIDIKVAITGSLSVKRSEFDVWLQSLGIIQVDVKKADYLITNDPNSGSSKNKTAREKGIPIKTEEEFRVIIGNLRGD